ncbi:hypothetical protein BDM02DRAFT_3185549 [Thelephora ganbajun]|uniref:Uncharacterized protein n=1 Tax=Thelephora ganbajun TaxID=370292 RepID=A0ACB6ZLE2_THEGA|nr:hypothetical protein BDM02DRAFT_3185549 [Thelephora ganbajun]
MPKSITLTLGAVFIGTSIAGILTGVVCTQVSMYFRRYQRDKTLTKLMVFAVWLLDLSHTAMLIASNWAWLITHFGNANTDMIPPTVAVSVVITALITIIVHGFFITRVYRLSRYFLIISPLIVLGLLRVGSACVTCAKMLVYGRFSVFLENVAWVFTLGLTTSSALDILLTGILLYYLRKSKTGFANMDHVIDMLSLYTIQSGLLTTIAIVISLGFVSFRFYVSTSLIENAEQWIGMHDNLVFLALHFMISKLYANSFLATLNARDGIRDRHIGTPQDPPLSAFSGHNPFRRQSRPLTAELPMQVDPDKNMVLTADAVGRVMGGIGVTSFSETLRVGGSSLDVRNTRGLDLDYKLSANTIV